MSMPMSTRTLNRQRPRSPELSSLITAVTSCLKTLNPRKGNLKNINPAPLNQFAPHLNPEFVTQVIKSQSNPYHALFFFNWASNPNPNPNFYHHNHRSYAAITDLLLSHSLFYLAETLLEKTEKFSDLILSKFIAANGSRGNVKAAIFWFHRAKEVRNGNCLFCCNAILGVLVQANMVQLAQLFYEQIVKDAKLIVDASTHTTMIRGFCKVGLVENARKVFDEMRCDPSLVTYNTLISGYCKKGDMDKAMGMFYKMLRTPNCLPDTVTYTTLVDGYCKKGDFDQAMKWMDDMAVRCCKPNLLTYNAIIYGLCLRERVDEAKLLMTKMRLNGVKENVSTHKSILKGLCIAERFDETVAYFSEMITKGIEPDAKAYEVVVNGYCKMKKPDEALFLLKEMYAKKINLNVGSFNALFRILVELGELDKAISLVKQMRAMGCAPNFISYRTVICELCTVKGRMQEVKQLVNDMITDEIVIDANMYGCLIKGYCEDGNEDMAMSVFYESVDKKHVINLDSFSVLIKHLCMKGKVAEAEKMYAEMCGKCCVVDVDSYRKILDEQLLINSGERLG